MQVKDAVLSSLIDLANNGGPFQNIKYADGEKLAKLVESKFTSNQHIKSAISSIEHTVKRLNGSYIKNADHKGMARVLSAVLAKLQTLI